MNPREEDDYSIIPSNHCRAANQAQLVSYRNTDPVQSPRSALASHQIQPAELQLVRRLQAADSLVRSALMCRVHTDELLFHQTLKLLMLSTLN